MQGGGEPETGAKVVGQPLHAGSYYIHRASGGGGLTRIAFATDIHRDARIFPWLEAVARKFDLVAVGGDIDFPYLGLRNYKLNFALYRLRPNAFQDRILRFAAREPGRRVVVVQGNHDNPDPRACNGTALEIAGLEVGGVGGSLPTGAGFPFELEEGGYRSVLQRLGRVDILVVHQPPYDTRCDLAYTGSHAGSKAVREYVEREAPTLVLTGHIHESPGVDRIGGTTVLNPGPFFKGHYGVADLAEGGVTARVVDLSASARP